jgi:hypothetical protein
MRTTVVTIVIMFKVAETIMRTIIHICILISEINASNTHTVLLHLFLPSRNASMTKSLPYLLKAPEREYFLPEIPTLNPTSPND